jgi:hypothetical protein
VNTKVTSPEAACEVNAGNCLASNIEPEDTTNERTAFPSKLSEIDPEVKCNSLISFLAAEADNSLVKFTLAQDPDNTSSRVVQKLRIG